ncbi:hypothetical protein K492DRAFT_207398 [Lichtheimia hyalospora FSU 10163]|nr:hypothetical protein K492DRAFT_207398 [Lichtheimia hyalospora FSU 10163]
MTSSSSSARTRSPSSSTPSSPFIAPSAGGGGSTITLKQRRGSLLRGDITTSPSTTIRNVKSRGGKQGGLSDDLVRNLGLDYDEVQKRTLTRWVNAKLSMAENADHVKHIEKDLKDGKRLLQLLSVVSGQSAPKPERMNMRIHQLSNVAQALAFLQKQIHPDILPDIGNEAIVNGDVKKTLALIFFIMLKFQVQLIINDHGDDYMTSLAQLSERNDIDTPPSSITDLESTPSTPRPTPATSNRKLNTTIADKAVSSTTASSEAKLALLYWVRIQLEDYIAANIVPPIQDFSRSWRTGLAFCLLLHRHDPTLIPDLLTHHIHLDMSEKGTWHTLLTMAFDLAEAHLAVPRYLEPQDLTDVDYPHESSVMMYVSEYYKVMSQVQRHDTEESRKLKTSRRRASIAEAVGDPIIPDEIQQPKTPSPTPLPDIVEEPDALMPKNEEKSAIANSPPTRASRTPDEAPVPRPMPSSRRHPHRHQRESSLPDSDKARIRADLNSRLMMQLTGHLPRGIHPLLDELLNIHQDIISFINNKTCTIDAIPEVLIQSNEATEYANKMMMTEEEITSKGKQLDAAGTARDTLTSPPEIADDTLIRLTDLQKSQVAKLYEALCDEWETFQELVQRTRMDLVQLATDLKHVEEGVGVYKEQAQVVKEKMAALQHMLIQVAPRDDKQHRIHPLNGDKETCAVYEKAVSDASIEMEAFDNNEWRKYRHYVRELVPAIRQAVDVHHGNMQAKRDALDTTYKQTKRRYSMFKRGMVFASQTIQLDEELGGIQAMMDSQQHKPTTDESIMDLESRVDTVKNKTIGLREEFYDLFSDQQDQDDKQGFEQRLDQLETRYRRVADWVDQVRIWFIQAGRIRSWIETRITILNERNAAANGIDPLGADFEAPKDAKDIHLEHEQLRREVERFEADDMTRLRNHVKKLTATDDTRDKLSPADASTIEITLETLNMLHQLTQLLHKRSIFVDIMVLRIRWEELFNSANTWIDTTHNETTQFMHGGARWKLCDNDSIQEQPKAEHVIQTLVDLENRISTFDQGAYAEVLDAYQEMEDLYDAATLPDHLENRQAAFEKSFADLMQRRAFCRKVVEQFLALTDVIAQFDHVVDQGSTLFKSMQGEQSSTGDDVLFDDQVQAFKERSAYLVSEVAVTSIPYPSQVPSSTAYTEDDEMNNRMNNERIQGVIEDYGMQLAALAEQLEDLLASQRQHLSLQERAKLLYDDMVRVTIWLQERTENLQQSTPMSLLEDDSSEIDTEESSRLEDECRALETWIQQNEYNRLIERAQFIEEEIDHSHASTIDRKLLINTKEELEEQHNRLLSAIDQRKHQLTLFKAHVEWRKNWTHADQTILTMAHELWGFIVNHAMFDPVREPFASDETKLHATLNGFKEKIDQVTTDILPQVQDRFDTMMAHDQGLSDDISMKLKAHHSQLNDKHQGIVSLLEYASKAIDQRISIAHVFGNQQRHIESGHLILEQAEEGCDDDIEEQVQAFKDQVNVIVATMMNIANTKLSQPNIDFGGQLQWEFDTIDPAEYHTRIQRHIQTFMQERQSELRLLEKKIIKLLDDHRYAEKIQQKIQHFTNEILQLKDWIVQRMDHIANQYMDPLADELDTSAIEKAMEDANHILTERTQIENDKVQPLALAIDQLFKERDDEAMEKLASQIDDTLFLFSDLKRIACEQLDTLNAMMKRAMWEQRYTATSTLLKALDDQVRHLGKQYERSDDLHGWKQSLDQLIQHKNGLFEEYVQPSKRAYEEFKDALNQCGGGIAMPIHIEVRLDSLDRTMKKVDNALDHMQQQLDFAQTCQILENDIDQALTSITQHHTQLQEFIQHKARWDTDKHNIDYDQLQKESDNFGSLFESLQQHTIVFIQQQYIHLKNQITAIPDTLTVKFQQLEEKALSFGHHLQFAKDIIHQADTVDKILQHANELERKAMSIQDELLVDNTSSLGAKEHVQRFHQQTNDLRQQVNSNVPYPQRQQQQREEDNVIDIQIQDESRNAEIKNMLASKCSLLDDLAVGLEQQLSCKERMSRCKVLLEGCKHHAASLQDWIKEKEESIEGKRVTLLECTDPVPLIQLQQAISAMSGLERVMNAKDNAMAVLDSQFEACITAFDAMSDDHQQYHNLAEEFDHLSRTYESTQKAWSALHEELISTVAALTFILPPTMIHHRAEKLVQQLTQLEQTIGRSKQQHDDELTDDQIAQWQKQVDKLDTSGYQKILEELENTSTTISTENAKIPLHAAKTQLDAASDIILGIRSLLTQLYDAVNLSKLHKTYAENANVVSALMTRAQELLDGVCNQFGVMTGDNYHDQRQSLLFAHRDAQQQYNECRDAFDDLCGYYEFAAKQQPDQDVGIEKHSHIEHQWKNVQEGQERLALLLNRSDRWVERYDAIEKLHRSLSTVQRDLSGGNRPTKHTSIPSLYNSTSTRSNDETNALGNLDKRLAAIQQELDRIVGYAQQRDTDDMRNCTAFSAHCERFKADLEKCGSTLRKRQRDMEEARLLGLYSDEIKQQCRRCEEQIQILKQQTNANPGIADKKPSTIRNIMKSYGETLTRAKQVHRRCKESIKRGGAIAERSRTLVDAYRFSQLEVERLKRPLEKNISQLQQLIDDEDEYLNVLKSVCKCVQGEIELMTRLNEYKATIARYSRSARMTWARRPSSTLLPSPDLADFDRRFEAMGSLVELFMSSGNEIKTNLQTGRISDSTRADTVAQSIDRHQEAVQREWSAVKMSANNTRGKLQELHMRQQASTKLRETMRHANDLRQRVQSLHLIGSKSISIEKQELRSIQDDMQTGALAKKIREVDALLSRNVTLADQQMKRQRQELNTLVTELTKLVHERQAQAEVEGNINVFMNIVDRMDEQMDQLSRLIESCAPHHARVTDQRFNKADLQGLLRQLVQGYKQVAPQITDSVAAAKAEARKQFIDQEQRVLDRLDKTLKQWTRVQSEAASREKELQACINQLGHEFFTKLAMTKSTSNHHKSARPPIAPRSGGFRSSTLSVENRQHRRTLTHSTSRHRNSKGSPPPKYVVSDPKNELDVQLGKIVNDSPYRMKIKMVPGEVGKYWFGEDQPRLVYCRILPSKMVMVRVGGGWEELSSFLKSHGNLQPIHTRSTASDRTNISADEGSESGSVHSIGGGGGGSNNTSSSSSRHGSSNSTGFVEGDKYIQFDDEGNHIAVKMSKAQDTARIPLSNIRRFA